MSACAKPTLRACRGVVTLELILALPVVLIVFIAAFQFAMAVIFQAAVTHAAAVGAREAGKTAGSPQTNKPADIDVVVAAVRDVVDANGIEITGVDGSGTKVILEDGDGPDSAFGDSTMTGCGPPSGPPLQSGEVRVTVCVNVLATPFCHALKDWGLSFLGTVFHASAVVKKEYPQDLSP